MPESTYAVRRSARSRRIRIRVDPDGRVEVVAPVRAAEREIRAFLTAQAPWVERVRARQLARSEASSALGLRAADRVRIYGEPLAVRRGAAPGRSARRAGPAIEAPAEEPEKAVGRLLRREARRVLEERVSFHAGRLGLRPGPLSVRDPRTRWGSCSSAGALSFSWRLVLAPPPVLDYVIVHELCHLRHHDHSPRFWAAVAAADPGWRRAAGWLRMHGSELHRSPF